MASGGAGEGGGKLVSIKRWGKPAAAATAAAIFKLNFYTHSHTHTVGIAACVCTRVGQLHLQLAPLLQQLEANLQQQKSFERMPTTGVCVWGVCVSGVCGVCVFCLVLLSLICSLALMCRLSAGDVATRGRGAVAVPEVAAPAMPAALRPLPSAPLPCALCPFIYVGHAALTEGCLLPALRLSCDNRARRAPLGSLLGSSSSSSSRAAPALLRPARQVWNIMPFIAWSCLSSAPLKCVCECASECVSGCVFSVFSRSLTLSFALSSVSTRALCPLNCCPTWGD